MKPSDYQVGYRVYHRGRQDFGVVTSTDNQVVVVEFENPTPRGNRSIGEFDEVWFRTHPNWLEIEIPRVPTQRERKFPPDEIDEYLTEDQVLAAYAEHGRLNWYMVKKGMGPNWPAAWEALGPGEGIFHPDECDGD